MMGNNDENGSEAKGEERDDESVDDWQVVSVDGHGSMKYLQLKYTKKIEELIEKNASMEKERESLMDERDALKESQEFVNKELDRTTEENNLIAKERDHFKEDRDFIAKELERVMEEKKLMAKEIESIKNDRDLGQNKLEKLESKYTAMTSKLHDMVECPVCLAVPTSGPIHVCPNGHFVCSNCKEANCPTCRGRMFSGKSLLAVTVIEIIDHHCKYEDCQELLPLKEYKQHLLFCPQRLVHCPGVNQSCGKQMALSKLYEHIITECKGSFNETCKSAINDKFPLVLTYKLGRKGGFALCWKGVYFYLSFEKVGSRNVFYVQLLGNAIECKEYVVNLAVHKINEGDLNGNHIQKFSGEPLPVDMNRDLKNENGLSVGCLQMEKLVAKGEDDLDKIGITVDIFRNTSNM